MSSTAYRALPEAYRRDDEKDWRYIAQRLHGDGTSTTLSWDVPLRGVQITDVLSGPLQLTGTLEPEIKRMKDADGNPLFKPWSTAIWAEYRGKIMGGGILVPSSYTDATWNIECAGFTAILAEQPYTSSWFGVEIDPLDVVRHIWDHWQGQRLGDLGFQLSNAKTGLKIGVELEQGEFDTENGPLSFESGPVKLNWYETHDLGQVIDDLAKNTPFDYHERHAWTGEEITHHLDFHYPRMGRRRHDLTFRIGENIAAIPTVSEDGDQYANYVLALGAGEGRAMKYALVGDGKSDHLRRVAVVTNKRANTVKKVNAFARRQLSRYKGLEDISEVAVRNHSMAPFGSFRVGDEILVEGDAGWRDVEHWARIVSYTIAPDESDTAVLTLLRSGKEPE